MYYCGQVLWEGGPVAPLPPPPPPTPLLPGFYSTVLHCHRLEKILGIEIQHVIATALPYKDTRGIYAWDLAST